MSDMPYGCKGCRCWTDQSPAYGLESETWYPNAMCPHHGLLADYTPERKDTGVYTVVQAWPTDEEEDARTGDAYTHAPGCQPSDCCGDPAAHRRDLSTPPDGPECPPGVHSMFDPCPGGCLNDDDYTPSDGAKPCEPWCGDRQYCTDGCHLMTTEEERGVFATVRRGISRLVARAYWRF